MTKLLTILFLLICLNGYGQTLADFSKGKRWIIHSGTQSLVDSATYDLITAKRSIVIIDSTKPILFTVRDMTKECYVRVVEYSPDSSKIGTVYIQGCDSMQAIKMLIKQLKRNLPQ